MLVWLQYSIFHSYKLNKISDLILELDLQPGMNEDKTDWSLNTLSELNHSVTTMESDIYFMRHCLWTVIIPAREHSETLNTAHSIKVWTARKKKVYEEV